MLYLLWLRSMHPDRDVPACLVCTPDLNVYYAMTRYGNYGDMFIKLLKDSEDETWDVYFVFEKDSPPDNVLANYEARLQFHFRLAFRLCTCRAHNVVIPTTDPCNHLKARCMHNCLRHA